MSQVVTRFAPSPTGELHIGGARTALFAWAYARRHGGRYLLRMEDTDQTRSSDASAANILRDLKWLGLDHDNTGHVPKQSDPERRKLYDAAVEKLKAAGLAYDDDGAVRFRMDKDIAFDDAVFGHIEFKTADLEDFVIQKGDGFPTFHLAVVVDDADMEVTHVIRGQEHLNNTAKHAALYDALGKSRPVWAHTPSIMNPDGSKMSKRDKAKIARAAAQKWAQNHSRDDFIGQCLKKQNEIGGLDTEDPPLEQTDFEAFIDGTSDNINCAKLVAKWLEIALPEIEVDDFRRSGFVFDTLLNYLALLGWSPGNDVERFGLDFIKENFSLERINKSNAKFDRDKLRRFNFEALMELDVQARLVAVKQHMAEYHPAFTDKFTDDQFSQFVEMYRERAQTLDDYATLGGFFIEAPTEYDTKAAKKNLHKNEGEGLKVLAGFKDVLAATDWRAEALHAAVEAYVADHSLKNMGSVAQPLRVALTGSAVSPPIDQTLELLGKDETLARIDTCLQALSETA